MEATKGTTTGGLLDVDGAARYLGVSPRTVYALKADRRISFVRVGRQLRFTTDHLDSFVAQNTVSAR
jgi:excisionase family DNA binding protein